MNIILASSSPRRTQILELAKIKHTVIASKCIEVIEPSMTPIQVVESLSYQKAYDVFKENQDDLVIGSDTIVVLDDTILGKPKSREDAFNTLSKLSGRMHCVITGVTILTKGIKKTFHEITNVYFENILPEQINEYIDNEYIYDKAGSYAVQGMFCKYITKIDGDYYNVMGLPIARLNKELQGILNE